MVLSVHLSVCPSVRHGSDALPIYGPISGCIVSATVTLTIGTLPRYHHHVSHTNKGAETKYSREYLKMVIQQLGTRYRRYKSLGISMMRQTNRMNELEEEKF